MKRKAAVPPAAQAAEAEEEEPVDGADRWRIPRSAALDRNGPEMEFQEQVRWEASVASLQSTIGELDTIASELLQPREEESSRFVLGSAEEPRRRGPSSTLIRRDARGNLAPPPWPEERSGKASSSRSAIQRLDRGTGVLTHRRLSALPSALARADMQGKDSFLRIGDHPPVVTDCDQRILEGLHRDQDDRGDQVDAVGDEFSSSAERDGEAATTAKLIQAKERSDVIARWIRFHHLRVSAASAGSGTTVAQVVYNILRSSVIHKRQDLAMLKQQLMAAMAEASAVEYDIVGRIGVRLAEGRQPRGRIAEDMGAKDVADFARQAESLRGDVQSAPAANSAIGAEHARRTLERLGVALENALGEAHRNTLRQMQRDRKVWEERANELVPALNERTQQFRVTEDKKRRLAAELQRMRNAVKEIRSSQERELLDLARELCREEGAPYSDDTPLEELCHPFDESSPGRERRRRARMEAAAEREREAVAERWKASLEAERKRQDRLQHETQQQWAEQQQRVEEGEWLRDAGLDAEVRLKQLSQHVRQATEEAERLQEDVRRMDAKVSWRMKDVRAAQRLHDLKQATRRLWKSKRTPHQAGAKFLSSTLAEAPYAPQFMTALQNLRDRLRRKRAVPVPPPTVSYRRRHPGAAADNWAPGEVISPSSSFDGGEHETALARLSPTKAVRFTGTSSAGASGSLGKAALSRPRNVATGFGRAGGNVRHRQEGKRSAAEEEEARVGSLDVHARVREYWLSAQANGREPVAQKDSDDGLESPGGDRMSPGIAHRTEQPIRVRRVTRQDSANLVSWLLSRS